MKFSKNFKQILSLFLAFLFIVDVPLANAAIAISATERPVDFHEDVANSSTPSDMPVAGYSEYFDKENINIIENLDLSQYSGMKGFVGYGIYDIDDNNCHFVNVPGITELDYQQNLKTFKTFNQHSYAVSRNTMPYSQCLSMSNSLGGYPISVDSAAENSFIDGYFATTSNAEIWVGATINTCSDSYYTNSINRTQFFTNFGTKEEQNTCSTLKRNVNMTPYGKWTKVNGETLRKCVVEFDSEDYSKPIKVCAPWWKVFRDYKALDMGLYDPKSLRKINQTDIPTTLNICTKYDADLLQDYEDRPRRDITCTSYYSRTVAPECSRNMKQKQCFVNECEGYVKSACRLKSQDTVGKGYIKGQIIQDKKKISVKVKDEITTYAYNCPPSPPSNKDCLEKSRALIWAKECPASQCQQLKECLLGAQEYADEEACQSTYNCEKIYADRSIPPLLDSDGNVLELYGLCEDGTQLTFFPNILDKDKKVCEESEEYNVTKQVTQKCILDRTFEDHTVNVAFTAKDDYEDNPSCIRVDKAEDSQINTSVIIDMKIKGFFKHRITKLFLDETTDFIYEGGSDAYLLGLLVSDMTPETSPDTTPAGQETCDINLTCTGFDSTDTDFYSRNQYTLMNEASKDTNIDSIRLDSTPIVKIYGLTDLECSNYASNNGFDSYEVSSNNVTNQADGSTTCSITLNKYTASDDQLIGVKTLDGSQLVYDFSGTMTKDKCLEKAVCIGGTYNEQNFGADYTTTGTCMVVSGTTPSSYNDYLRKRAGCKDPKPFTPDPTACVPGEYPDSVYTQLNGFESILVFEDFLGGPWGYYSNFNTYKPASNFDRITTEAITNNDTFPLLDLSEIVDYQWYVAHIDHWAYKSKKPSILSNQNAGMLAIGLRGLFFSGGSALLLYIVLLVIAKAKDMDAQNMSWAVYKDVSTTYFSRYERRLVENRNIGPYNVYNRVYLEASYKIPKQEGGVYNQMLTNYLNAKKQMFTCNGWDQKMLDLTIHPAEKSIITGHPSCKWYNPWCEKSDYYSWNLKVEINKKVNTIFAGADQTVIFLLPYKGEFKVQAFDKYDNLLSTINLTNDSFVNSFSLNGLKFAQIHFGQDMQLANGIDLSRACVTDPMVEWGGGISGVYEENNDTGTNLNCIKSNDIYVKDHAAVKIKIQPMNMPNKLFVYNLTKPIPFANRVFAATLDKNQERKYRCYNEFPDCGDSEFSEE